MERTAANLANHLAAQGHVTGIVFKGDTAFQPSYSIREDVIRCPVAGTPPDYVQEIEQFRPDVVVALYASATEAPIIVSICQTGIPVVLREGSNPDRVVNTNWAGVKGITPEQARLERLAMMAGCARICFTLPQYRDSLPEELREASVAFPDAFAPANPADIARRSDTGRRIFLNIGGLEKIKNVMVAIRAFAAIAQDVPDWDFHVFSASTRSDSIGSEVEDFIARHDLVDRVKLFEPTSEIGREYGRSHVHVIACKEEGLPDCVAEAARHALPSIGFACCAGTNAMIVDDHNGLLVDCGEGEIDRLAQAMRHAALDQDARERWGRTALEESHIYDPETVFTEWDAVIAAAAADRATPEERMRSRFGEADAWRRLRAIQRASFEAEPWPAPQTSDFDSDPPLVSIIVPLFNKGDYIGETLSSIAACPYPAKDVIVVDDCSTDTSLEIAADYCDRHGWSLIRHAHNQGLSVSRNTGLEAARGDYVHFWDADDIYAPDGIEQLLRKMHNNAADIGTGLATRDGEVIPGYVSSRRDVACVTYARQPECFATASSCFKVYRRAFLIDNDLRFEPGLFMQDTAFNLCAFPLAERITMTPAILGEYRRIKSSGSKQMNDARFASALRLADITREFYTRQGLHALEAHRQTRIVAMVWEAFVRRANLKRTVIANTLTVPLDFNFLGQLRDRMADMSFGSIMDGHIPEDIHLPCFAIREGYMIWLPELLHGLRPETLRPELLAKTPDELEVVTKLSSVLRQRS
ncbi:glycosyltransferase [Salipiger sp. IMCC34102]|uniref:glycosyltransferase n=1 Tax=Salipiger sp. IMCC34102 TaxID=2510647 RepID=UPI0013EDA266|nr:glycosyltransferase [Salipiger sp. IMCC34102]